MSYDEIIESLAKKYSLTYRECERIVDSQFKLLYETIRSGDKKVISFIHLGKFKPIVKRYNVIFEQDKTGIYEPLYKKDFTNIGGNNKENIEHSSSQ